MKFLLRAIVFFGLVSGAVQAEEGREVLVLFALEDDLKSFGKGLEAAGFLVREGVFEGELAGGKARVRAAVMGRGGVQSALTTARLVREGRPEVMVSIGPAGALDAGLEVGAWFRVEGISAYQSTAVDRMEVKEPGFLGVEGMGWIRELPGARCASGERFVKSREEAGRLREETGCGLVEMNLFGVLSVLEEEGVSSIHLRVVSDHADESAGGDFAKFREDHGGEGGAMAPRVLRSLPGAGSDPGSTDAHPFLKELLGE